jgi:hypothetical protein
MEARQLLRPEPDPVGGDPVSRGPRRLVGWLAALAACGAAIAGALPALAQNGDDFDTPRIYATVKTPGGADFCPRLATDPRPVTGGCVARALAPMRFRILTPFGPARFAECDLRFVFRIGGDGSVALDDIDVPGTSPCGDIRACQLESERRGRPWVGAVVPDGQEGFRLRLDACLDTCAGWFEGQIELGLLRERGGWRVRAAEAQLGDTGLEIDGDVPLKGADFRLRSSDDR